MTPARLGTLMWRELRENPPTRPRQTEFWDQKFASALEPVLWESPPAKASARAEFLEGPQKGQGLGAGVRCPRMAGFETRPPDLTPTSPGTSSPPHPKEDPVTLCQGDQATPGHGRQEGWWQTGSMQWDIPGNMSLVPTMSLRKTSKMRGRYKKTQPNINLFLLCSHLKRRKPHAPAGCLARLASPSCG